MKPIISDFDKYKRQQRKSAWILVTSVVGVALLLLRLNSIGKIVVVVIALLSTYGVGRWEIESIERKKRKIEFLEGKDND